MKSFFYSIGIALLTCFGSFTASAQSSAQPDQVRDGGVPELAARVPPEILAGVSLFLKGAKEAGSEMPDPPDLMPAQEALQWISARTYVLEPTSEWPSPALVEQRGWSDCKGKCLWLADRLLRLGYRDVKILIGKVPDLDTGHAWVEMDFRGQSYILDGTYRGKFSIIPKERKTVHADHEVLHEITPTNYK
jgi:hypothetical protein